MLGPYLQSRWKALACPTLITITFGEEAVPPPGRLGLYGWRRWQPNPPVTAEIWGNRQKMHRTQLIKVESQMCNNTGVQTPTYGAQEYQKKHQSAATITFPHRSQQRGFDTWYQNDVHLLSGYLVFITTRCNIDSPRTNKQKTFAFSNSNPFMRDTESEGEAGALQWGRQTQQLSRALSWNMADYDSLWQH